MQRTGRLEAHRNIAAQVTLPSVEAYVVDLKNRVRSVTVWNCIFKLRRAAQLLAPSTDFSWLAEIEKDVALEMEPRSKFDRLVLTGRLVEAGMTLIVEAESLATHDLAYARGVRNGLIVAPARILPHPAEEFCRPGDRVHVQESR